MKTKISNKRKKGALRGERGSKVDVCEDVICVLSTPKTPWPGIARTVYGDHKRFVETYFAPYPGYYFTGDGGHRDNQEYYQGSESVSLPFCTLI